ncbi:MULTISPECIES: GntR family transcriptional regulator [Sphingomonadales]|uniref:HTH-type transcriptional repressor YvoA n=1 Tax=Edaphosphingomonas haloaromaticamans TaxID=653954 RepID=A0A1S1HDB0_9SPHN|nr:MULTISPECIES: GntR family transcriptional regulator [Sphingomonas]MDX3882921.1 GntR family transcriptional regulator [Sphingomonas sp.]OHT20194.1 HTH-type transcriptional repressor YvoA [Sphingomonas haloaromaticamans]
MSATTEQAAGSSGRKHRYQELAEDLRQGILRGDFPDPAQFPTESVLCARYGVSRFTVREALRALQNEGLIQRRRGSGTVIQPASARGGALHQPLSNVGEILQYARDTEFHFTPKGMVPLPRKLAAHAGMAPGGRWYHFRGLRTSRGLKEPIALTDAYISQDLEAAAREILPNEAIFRQLEQLSGVRIARVTQDIQAVPASGPVAAELGIPRRSACLRILRCYLDANGRVLELSLSHHPGNRFAYSMHIDVDK